jgi:biotin synthase-related radical SAM superfamily protein
MNQECLPEKVRVSLGSAVVLGLMKGRLNAEPTTAYMLTYRRGKCLANCGFCPQAKDSRGRADMLSRVTWSPFPTEKVISKIRIAYKRRIVRRVCIQALNYPTVFEDLLSLVKGIRSKTEVPVSVSCQPLDREKMEKLRIAGVNRIGIPLDAATEELFGRVKGRLANGPYTWKEQLQRLGEAVDVFGKGFVTTHLIAGLGETEKEIVQRIQWCVDMGIYPGLFSFTPIRGTALESNPQPPLSYYRRIQIAQYLITHGETRYEKMKFSRDDRLINFGVSEAKLRHVIKGGIPFITSGCPDCNRPYYNERPRGPLYNYPRLPMSEEISEIEEQIETSTLED